MLEYLEKKHRVRECSAILPGTVGGKVPADPLVLGLRGGGSVTGAGCGGNLPTGPLAGGG